MGPSNLFNINGKKALITGAARGIGEAIANGFIEAGCEIGIFDINEPQSLNSNTFFKQLDLTSEQEINKGFEEFINYYDTIDILVNCAGVTIPNISQDYVTDDWIKTMSINLTSIFTLCRITGNAMIGQQSGGSIINVTSIGAEQGFPSNPAYCSSKGGLKQLTKALAYDWGQYNIRVNNLVPGYTNTPMNKNSWNTDELRESRSSHTFLNRWAQPEEMVGPAIFLAADASSYITGSDLMVDGGWTAKGL